jgi:hypothetical protein
MIGFDGDSRGLLEQGMRGKEFDAGGLQEPGSQQGFAV